MIRRPPLKPTDLMPWGPYKGTPMGKLPLDHLLWLREQSWLQDWPAIHAYVQTRKKELDGSFGAIVRPDDQDQPASTFEDYLRWRGS